MSVQEIGPDSTMGDILNAYPSAKVALFQRYHIGGCASCGYQPEDTLTGVLQTHNIADSLDTVIDYIQDSQDVEARLHIHPKEVAEALDHGEKLQFFDVRSAEEWEARHIPDAPHLTVELKFEILDSWPKDAPIIFYSNQGRRSLDTASYFRAYGFTNARSLNGGMDAWLGRGRYPVALLSMLGNRPDSGTSSGNSA